MANSEFTSGQWAIARDDRPGMAWNNHIVDTARPHVTICFMTHSGKPDNSEAEDWAHLIAAAPDLLAALEVLLAESEIDILTTTAKDIARAAIARATGAN